LYTKWDPEHFTSQINDQLLADQLSLNPLPLINNKTS
jgi:hypothetical protein